MQPPPPKTPTGHVEYERGSRRLIRVIADVVRKFSGGKIIIPRDDAGRAINMHVDTRKTASGPIHIESVRALLLCFKCKKIQSFPIQTRLLR